jgi:hypothetical protein
VIDCQLSESEVGSINVEAAVFRDRFFVTSAPPTFSCLRKREHVDTDALRKQSRGQRQNSNTLWRRN